MEDAAMKGTKEFWRLLDIEDKIWNVLVNELRDLTLIM